MRAESICIHNTANHASAAGEVEFMKSQNTSTSYHFAVDDKEAVQALPLDRNGWHAGDGLIGYGNRKTIGIEICYSYNGDTAEKENEWKAKYKPLFEKSQENAAELVAYLFYLNGWEFDKLKIRKHQDFSGKYCPHRTLSDYGWGWFLDLCETKYNEMYGGDPMTKEEKTEFEELKKIVLASNREYNTIDEVPCDFKPTIEKLVKAGIIRGKGENRLGLTYATMRILVILDRSGAFSNI